MPRILWAIVLIVLLLGAGAYLWLQRERPAPLLVPPPAQETPLPDTAAAPPQIAHPMPVPQTPQALPELDASDPALRAGLGGFVDARTLVERIIFEEFVRRVVATIDNLPRLKVNLRRLPVKTVPGSFLTVTDEQGIRLRPDNSVRYAAYMRVVETLDAQKLVALYVRFYPLFQQAYVDLGYPRGYFNDRLIEVIDHLLDAPQLQAPVPLVQPKVMYQYADPELEARSAGQKALMRIGNANAATIKAKLREIRAELLRVAPAKAPG